MPFLVTHLYTEAALSSSRLLKKPGRLKSVLHGRTYVTDSPCSVGAHACGSRMWRAFFSNLLEVCRTKLALDRSLL